MKEGAAGWTAGGAGSGQTTSIQRRTMKVVMTTTLLALLLSATALLIYEVRTLRLSWLQDLQTQTDLVAQASVPALNADDSRAARENLALLRMRSQIEAAALYSTSGAVFAAYTAPGQAALAPTLVDHQPGHRFDGDRIDLSWPVMHLGETVGTMVVRARYDVLQRLLGYVAILGSVMIASLVLAALVARRLQRTITDPIVAVSRVAREVMQQGNYALRAPKTTDDEVGTLVDAFNNMLQELGGQAAALQATDRRKDEFLALLAHELRNPLAPVTTALSILERGTADAATQAHLVALMKRQMQQLVRLIDDLMEVSRISTGHLKMQLQRLDLADVLRAAVESIAPVMLERGHILAVAWQGPMWVDGDRMRLGQVFVNLLANAAKYTAPGGRIELGFELLSQTVVVRVSDNGIGIAPAMQREVFEMFVQVDRSLSRAGAGLGVGLSLARQLVALHGGALDLHSAGLGSGCTFAVCLPRQAPPTAATASTRHAPATEAARSLRILVADDNHDFADSLAALLELAGHHVQVVYDGAAALRATQTSAPDVGLFDVGMPILDGYGLARAIRDQGLSVGCRLVALTGWGQQADKERALAAGFDHHLVKPVDPEALLLLLASMPAARA